VGQNADLPRLLCWYIYSDGEIISAGIILQFWWSHRLGQVSYIGIKPVPDCGAFAKTIMVFVMAGGTGYPRYFPVALSNLPKRMSMMPKIFLPHLLGPSSRKLASSGFPAGQASGPGVRGWNDRGKPETWKMDIFVHFQSTFLAPELFGWKKLGHNLKTCHNSKKTRLDRPSRYCWRTNYGLSRCFLDSATSAWSWDVSRTTLSVRARGMIWRSDYITVASKLLKPTLCQIWATVGPSQSWILNQQYSFLFNVTDKVHL